MNVILCIVSLLVFVAVIYSPMYQLLTEKLKVPTFVRDVISFLIISLFFSNSPWIVDEPYHVIPFMTTYPYISEQSIPDTLTNNMQEFLILMTSMIYLYTILRFCFRLEKWVKKNYSDAITSCAAFFLYHLSLLIVCLILIPAVGYGQLFLFRYYAPADIMVSIQELVLSFRNDGMSTLGLYYRVYIAFSLITVAGIFVRRFVKKHNKNEVIRWLTSF